MTADFLLPRNLANPISLFVPQSETNKTKHTARQKTDRLAMKNVKRHTGDWKRNENFAPTGNGRQADKKRGLRIPLRNIWRTVSVIILGRLFYEVYKHSPCLFLITSVTYYTICILLSSLSVTLWGILFIIILFAFI